MYECVRKKAKQIIYCWKMPAFCVVSDCELKYAHSGNVSFHKFPLNNPELLKKWIEFTDRGPNWKPSRWSSICSRHFVSADFRDFLTRKCLKKSAVPSVMIRKNSNSSGSDANFPGAGQMIGKNGNEYRSNQVIHPIIVVKSLGNRDKETRPLEGATCSLCGYYQDDTDHNGSLNLHENIADTMLKKCFPTTLLRHDLESNNICGECAQLLRLFSEFVDKVIAYQKELQSRTTAEKEIGGSASGSEVNYSGHRSTAIGTAGVGCKEMATNNVFIKQEPINVKQEIVDISGKRSTVHSDSSYSVFSQTAPAVSLPFLNHHRDRVGNYTSSFCSFCDRIFVNNYELESHICNTNRHQRREISAATNNNCEIMEIITLNNSISYIDLAEDDTFQPITNHAMKVEHLSDFERRERIESDHAYAKRIEVFNPKLKEEINYDSTDSYESNIEVYEPSQNDLMVDLSNNNSGNESDFNDTSLFTMPKTMMITVSGLHTCDRCDVRFETAQALHEHCRTMHALKNKVCSVCSADFKSIHDYLVHKNKMHAIGHQCSQCRRSFAFKHALSNHKRFTCSPGTSDQFYSCKYCGKRFRNRMSMNDHCKMCSASILNEKTKEGGIDQKVPLPSLEVEVPMIAETSTVTTAKSNPVIPAMPAITRAPLFHTVPIIASQMTVTALGNPNNIVPEPKKMLACEVCGSRFSKRFNLTRHMQCHQPKSDRPIKCDQCAQIFENLHELKAHLDRGICRNTEISPSTNNGLHTIDKLEDDITTHRLYPFVCETCGKAFQTYPNLRQHIVSHENERKFNCHLCPKVFKRSTGLNQHIRGFHYQIKPYSCAVCHYSYALKADMLRCRHSKLKNHITSSSKTTT